MDKGTFLLGLILGLLLFALATVVGFNEVELSRRIILMQARQDLQQQQLEQVLERQYRILQALDNTYNMLNEHLRGNNPVGVPPPLFPERNNR